MNKSIVLCSVSGKNVEEIVINKKKERKMHNKVVLPAV